MRASSGRSSPASVKSVFAGSAWRTTSGPRATPGRAGRAARSTTTSGPSLTSRLSAANRPPRASAGWRSGTWSSCSSTGSSSTAASSSISLPAPSIDTGAGLERVSCVVQGKTSNYDTDLLRSLVDRASEISNKPYGGTRSPDDVSMRVIADHARTTAFMIAQGIMPDRTGREYVLRRVMRRAIRHGHRLGIEKPFLAPGRALASWRAWVTQYPELRERNDLMASVTVEAEEVRFRQTIERGLGLLGRALRRASSRRGRRRWAAPTRSSSTTPTGFRSI